MRRIVVASQNPVKINATLQGFQKMFPKETFEIEGISVPSGVSDQPQSDDETFQGALNRAENASKETSNADYWVGIEGGIEKSEEDMFDLGWVVIKSKDGNLGKARTGTFMLPPRIAELILQGQELGEAADIVFAHTNIKQGIGAVGALTDNVIDRTHYCEEAVVLALVPFKNEHLFYSLARRSYLHIIG